MIQGVEVRDLIVREDERGWLTEMLSVNMGDEDLCHIYAAMCRPGVEKAFHAHLKQADRFVCIEGTAKIGLVDLRGNISPSHGYHARKWHYLGADEWPNDLHSWLLGEVVEATDGNACITEDDLYEHWLSIVGESHSFLQQQTVILSSERPQVLTIPPGVAHGQMALGGQRSVILNAPTVAFNRDAPDELRMPADSFGYQWEVESK